jgi:signal transduction histidine kinase
MRPPRSLLVVLAAITMASAAGLGWLAWDLLRHDEAVEAQRDRARLDQDARQVAEAITRALRDADEQLSRWTSTTPAALSGLLEGGLGVIFTAEGVRPIPPGRLVFYPALPSRPEPPAALFADGDRSEYLEHNPSRAMQIYRDLARSKDPATQAAGLMALARVQHETGDYEAALATYDEMAMLGDAPVIGLPAELVARDAQARLLAQLGRSSEARHVLASLATDLSHARWLLTRGQYEYLVDSAKEAGVTVPTSGLAAAEAVQALWRDWHEPPITRGRRLMRVGGVRWFVIWQATREGAAAWLVEPAAILAKLPIAADLAVALSDADGVAASGNLQASARSVVLTTEETGLPWAISVGPTARWSGESHQTRTRLLVAGLGVMLLFLMAGAYFVGRAIQQEADLARLQSEFVAAVSHEFRTPLAAMRQLSELLASHRVPLESRRQAYYESLAAESRRLQRLVENLLNFGRLEAGVTPYPLEPIDPRSLVAEVVADFQTQLARPDCRIEVADSDAAATFMADRSAVALALHNLLDNAVKYSAVGKTVRIDWTRRGDQIALNVRDEGPGIAPGEEERIFQKFVRGAAAATANVRGTGVGLAMVRLVARGHGGDVVIENHPGAGATFTMLLPAAQS